MPFISGYSTEMPADDLVAGLIALYKGEVTNGNGEPITTMPVTIVSDTGKKKEVFVQIGPGSTPFAPLADRSSVIHCVTTAGYSVDFMFPPDEQRVEGILGAIVFIDPDAVERPRRS